MLSDGVLWDTTTGKEIHKFDKLNQNVSGIFHPNGLEVIFFIYLLKFPVLNKVCPHLSKFVYLLNFNSNAHVCQKMKYIFICMSCVVCRIFALNLCSAQTLIYHVQ